MTLPPISPASGLWTLLAVGGVAVVIAVSLVAVFGVRRITVAVDRLIEKVTT